MISVSQHWELPCYDFRAPLSMEPLQVLKSEELPGANSLYDETGTTRLELPLCDARTKERVTISPPGELKRETGSNAHLLVSPRDLNAICDRLSAPESRAPSPSGRLSRCKGLARAYELPSAPFGARTDIGRESAKCLVKKHSGSKVQHSCTGQCQCSERERSLSTMT